MTKGMFKSIMMLMVFAAVLVLVLTKLDVVISVIKSVFSVLAPFILGFAIAYIVNIPFNFFYSKAFASFDIKNKKEKTKKDEFLAKIRMPLSLLVSFVIFFAIIALLIGIIIPQVASSVQSFIDNFESYYISLQEWVIKVAAKFGFEYEFVSDIFADINEFISKYAGTDPDNNIDFNTILELISNFLFPSLVDITKNIYNVVYNIILSIFVSVYYLANKKTLLNQCKKISYAVIPRKHLGKVLRFVDLCNNKVGKFLYGKIIDSAIIGVLCFIGLKILDIDYALLLSVFVGVTNIIPFFGPIIGAIPGVIILLLVSPIDALWFVIFVIVLQQADGNIIGPKILGDTVGVSGFWIMFSVLVGGGIFGFPGMLLGVPVFAVIYTILGEKVNNRIVKLGYLSEDKVRVDPLPKVAYEDGHILWDEMEDEENKDETE